MQERHMKNNNTHQDVQTGEQSPQPPASTVEGLSRALQPGRRRRRWRPLWSNVEKMKPCQAMSISTERSREEKGIKLLKPLRECLRVSEVLKEMKSYPNRNLLQRFSVEERYRGTPR